LLQFLHTLFERRLKFHRSKTFGAQAAIERRCLSILRSSRLLEFPPTCRILAPERGVIRNSTAQSFFLQDVPSSHSRSDDDAIVGRGIQGQAHALTSR